MANQERTQVVSIRLEQETLQALDRMAKNDGRTRANLIGVLLTRTVAHIPRVAEYMEQLVQSLHEEEEGDPDSRRAEYLRGQFLGTKDMLSRFLGANFKDQILQDIRNKSSLPIPHVVPVYRDGKRYGFDSDAG